MPQMTVDISVGNVAKIIQSMNTQEIEILYLLLTEEGKELLERKKDLELGRVRFLTRCRKAEYSELIEGDSF